MFPQRYNHRENAHKWPDGVRHKDALKYHHLFLGISGLRPIKEMMTRRIQRQDRSDANISLENQASRFMSFRVCGEDETYDQAARWISTGQLNPLQGLHIQPINLVVYEAPLGALRPGTTHLEAGFTLICVQRLSLPNIATEQPPLAG